MHGDCRDHVQVETSLSRLILRCRSNLNFIYSNLSNYRFNQVQSIPVNSGQFRSKGRARFWAGCGIGSPDLCNRNSHIPRKGHHSPLSCISIICPHYLKCLTHPIVERAWFIALRPLAYLFELRRANFMYAEFCRWV